MNTEQQAAFARNSDPVQAKFGTTQAEIRNIFQRTELQRQYKDLNWIGTLDDYLKVATANPTVTDNAFQRVHAMIM